MTKYRFYITDLYNGCLKGTDNIKTAEEFALCEDFFVLDTETGEWMCLGWDDENKKSFVKRVPPEGILDEMAEGESNGN